MAILVDVLHKETKLLRRNGQLRVLLLAFAVLLLAAFASGWRQSKQWQADTAAAQTGDQQVFTSQGARNPHDVAHFGQYAFKPIGTLASFDPGVLPATGRGLWMEAHTQNTAEFRSLESGGSRSLLSPAWLLQLGLPLLVVLAGFGLWAAERESGTLRLQIAQSGRWQTLLLGKAATLGGLALLFWLPLAALLAWKDPTRTLLLLAAYALYGWTWMAMTLAVSARVRHARSALAILLAAWLVSALLLPRLATDTAEHLHPSPASSAFWAAVQADQSKGLSGHNSEDAREKALLAQTLKQYGVQTEAELPISFAGVSLQASEEHGNAIYDKHFNALWQTYGAQDRVRLWNGLLSPLLPLQALSQAAAGSDWQHHRHFTQAAEQHRRALQVFLNGDMRDHGKGKDFDYQAEASLWQRAPQWAYAQPTLIAVASPVWPAFILLLLWGVVASLLAVFAAKKCCREVLQ
jgi:ABC-2 type transport system permease protein